MTAFLDFKLKCPFKLYKLHAFGQTSLKCIRLLKAVTCRATVKLCCKKSHNYMTNVIVL